MGHTTWTWAPDAVTFPVVRVRKASSLGVMALQFATSMVAGKSARAAPGATQESAASVIGIRRACLIVMRGLAPAPSCLATERRFDQHFSPILGGILSHPLAAGALSRVIEALPE